MTTDISLGDGEARRAIEQELETTFLVEAGAGTGKTTSLVRRMVALLREGKTRTDRLATVTFTRKASAHLREMFQLSLEEAYRGEADSERRKRLGDALRDLDRCFIGTIHSFCARLIRERPLEAGVDPEFEEMEESADRAFRRAFWDDYVQRMFVEEKPVLQELAGLGINLDDLRSTYEVISNYPDVVPAATPVPKPNLAHARKEVTRFLTSVERELPETVPHKGWDRLQLVLRRALRLKRILDFNADANLVRLMEALDQTGKMTQNRWPHKRRVTELKHRFDALRDTVVRPALDGWREYLHPILLSAVRPGAEDLRRRRLASGQLNFQDLLIIARDLLRDHTRVRKHLQGRFTHLIVDEFQDTDPIQAEVVFYLTSEISRERDWRKLRPRPGALFVVGDPKQSIYRFRRADIVTYHRAKEIILRTGGRVLELTTNFRSTREICGWVNELFHGIFPKSGTREQAAYARLDAYRRSGDQHSGVFKLETISDRGRRADVIAREDAARIAQWIRSTLDSRCQILEENGTGETHPRDVKAADFMIILRHRHRLHLYAMALESEGIPYEISGARSFRESADIADLLLFLRAVADPDDPVALVSFLRGDLWGVDDNALYDFRRAGGQFSYLTQPPKTAGERIGEAFAILQEARQWVREVPPGAALGRICERLGMIAHGAAQALGDTRSGNLLKAITMARRLSAQGQSFTEIIDRLSQLAGDEDVEEMSVEPGRSDAVRILNLHRAKGLEAPIVFLADPNTTTERAPLFSVNWEAEQPEGHFLVVRNEGFQSRELARPLHWDHRVSDEKIFRKAEEDRLLYVAATRARNTLIVSAHRRRLRESTEGRPSGPWTALSGSIDRALSSPKASATKPPFVPLEELSGQMVAARSRLRRAYGAVAQETYRVMQITRVAEGKGPRVSTYQGSGRGVVWGRMLHRLLESLMGDEALDVEACTEFLLLEEGLPLDEKDQILRMVDGVGRSDLWQRACGAKKRFVEVPFALTVPSSELGVTVGAGETILKGVIDLVFSEHKEWVIVDYKSDPVQNNLAHLVSHYGTQVRHYRRYWERLTGEATKAALFFIETGEVVWMDEE